MPNKSGERGLPDKDIQFSDIQFAQTPLYISPIHADNIIKIVSIPGHAPDFLIFDNEQKIWRINSKTGENIFITQLDNFIIDGKTRLQIKVSPCSTYAAITCLNYSHKTNCGVVIELATGNNIFPLNDFAYHSEQTDFPVDFFQHQGQCHIVYASDWNNLDIINLITKECLTTRHNDEITNEQRKDAPFTEWAGELKISPDGKRVATIGWAWHPVGIAWNFSLEKWITNKWEADFGKSKIILGDAWSYFWHSPFAWLDNEKIIIWGDPATQDSHDIPKNNAIIYNAISGEKLLSFNGPTMDIFETHGQLLFSGTEDNTGISIWNCKNGQPMGALAGKFQVLAYHNQCKRFIARNNHHELYCIDWELLN